MNIPIGRGDKEDTADDVAEGDGDEVADGEVPPGQRGGRRQIVPQKETGGDEVHVGDGVFETAGDEGHDRHVAGKELAGDFPRRRRHEDRQADEPVAEDAADEGDAEGELALDGGKFDRLLADGAVLPEAGLIHEPGEEEGAEEVADDDHPPVLQHLGQADLAVEDRRGEEAVAGEELGPADDDEHQADGEDAAAEEAGNAVAEVDGGIAGDDRHQFGAEGDIEAGEETEDEGAAQGLAENAPSAGVDRRDRFLGGEKTFVHGASLRFLQGRNYC